ncbi:hypothetical protein VOLCADRAFT_98954 [Volvox carteri f. nagariensis]|uniref:Uncharacterized protein n=1 Tax=Volvox carteri f. nagariensis TaxID=3068 RepID=D8UGP8_VOLCA|nr:uncharacterized protein VOLCADRAFT_98954 [Volvox carteri f. nagariensis]EFJ41086.1 hypothetical protein VOLCADRAFT_98954 [Volvox carteri f. nagariensis]|eukprot:XP_002957849.1 hypothetical protein VOLCADRAFT_98954 [Volvox carteri f. nagariensis]
MTAGGEHAGLHKRWLERKLEVEVGKVQAKLLSKGLTVPVPDPELLETEARLAQAHLPKLFIDLYGRNPNGTLKLSPDANKRSGPAQPATLVQKLDRLLNPAVLSPLPLDVAVAHGLPLSCCDAGDSGAAGSGAAGTGRGGGAISPVAGIRAGTAQAAGPSGHHHHHTAKQSSHSNSPPWGGGVGWGGVGPMEALGGPRVSRSPPQGQGQPQPAAGGSCRPDLQAADLRIDDAVSEVHRVALQASEMCPRERVLYLARQANPNFSLPHPRTTTTTTTTMQQQQQLTTNGLGGPKSRRDLYKKSFVKRGATNFTPDPTADGGGGGGGGNRGHKLQGGAVSTRRGGGGMAAAQDSRHSPEVAATTPLGSASPGGGCSGGATGDGSLPPLGARSRPGTCPSTAHECSPAAEYDAAASAAAAAELAEVVRMEATEAAEALPRLTPATLSPMTGSSSGEMTAAAAGGGEELYGPSPPPPLPKLPPVHSFGSSSTGLKTNSLIGLWGAAAAVHAAAEMDAARAAAEAQELAEAEAAEAEAEAAEAAAAAAEAALEAEVAAEAHAAAGLLSQVVATAGSDSGSRGGDRGGLSGAEHQDLCLPFLRVQCGHMRRHGAGRGACCVRPPDSAAPLVGRQVEDNTNLKAVQGYFA